jgi:hypothetical protein
MNAAARYDRIYEHNKYVVRCIQIPPASREEFIRNDIIDAVLDARMIQRCEEMGADKRDFRGAFGDQRLAISWPVLVTPTSTWSLL